MTGLERERRWSLLIPTSMGVRLTPHNRQPVHTSKDFTIQVTSAESNAASVASFLGEPVKVLTALVGGSPIARIIAEDLGRRHMDVEARYIEQGGPWGYRHQINIADSGFGSRGPRVHNDRAGEAGRTLAAGDFDLHRIFDVEGVRVVHTSGLFAALSPSTGALCLEIARKAKEAGSLVSFDLNYRASFWQEQPGRLREVFREIASLSDVLIGNEEDFQLALGVSGPEAGGKDVARKIDSFKSMIDVAGKEFPRVRLFATTLREVISANEHVWGAIVRTEDKESGSQPRWEIIEPRPIQVLDRIGGGDGFVGGMLYGLLKGWSPGDCLHFGWASGALAVSMETDYCQPADESQIWSIWSGDARVKR
ncbi:MAG: sugar kinase [Spirochaetota bacterium]